MDPDRVPRDYLAGSLLAGRCARSSRRFFEKAEGPLGKLRWREVPPRSLSACLAAAVLSNTLLLILLHGEIGLWGIALRGTTLAAALAGLLGPRDWDSVRRSSFVMRLMGKSNAHG